MDEGRAVAVPEMPPEFLARYELVAKLGEGGMGSVWRGRRRADGRPVAVKVLNAGAVGAAEGQQRLADEARVCARLEHPNVVRLLDADVAGAAPWLVFELVEGRSLKQLIAPPARLPLARALSLLAGVARGLAHAHGLGVTHRDLKPDNVLVTQDDVPKVSDFGLAKLGDVTRVRTKTGVVLGTPLYLAPEQITGKPLGPATDLYGFGVLAFEVLAGEPPFASPNLVELLSKHLKEPPPSLPAAIGGRLGGALDRLLRSCLAKDPAARPRDAAAVAAELERLVAAAARPEAPAAAPRCAGRPSVPAANPARRRAPVVFAGLAAAVALGVVLRTAGTPTDVAAPSGLAVGPPGARAVLVSWRQAAPAAAVAALAEQGAGRPEERRLEPLAPVVPAVPGGDGACVAWLGGLAPDTAYELRLVGADGPPLAFRTAREPVRGLEPVWKAALDAEGGLSATVAAGPCVALVATTGCAAPAPSLQRSLTLTCPPGWLRARGAAAVDLATLEGGRHRVELRRVLGEALAAVLPALERDRAGAAPFFAAWDHGGRHGFWFAAAARAGRGGGAGGAARARDVAALWQEAEARLRERSSWFAPLARLLPGLPALLRDPPPDEALRSSLALALVPLRLMDGAARREGLPGNPAWAAALAAPLPFPVTHGQPSLPGAAAIPFAQEPRPRVPFPCLVDPAAPGAAALPFWDEPVVREQATSKRYAVALADDPARVVRAELVLTLRSAAITNVMLVDLNEGATVAAFHVRPVDFEEASRFDESPSYAMAFATSFATKAVDAGPDERAAAMARMVDGGFPKRLWTIAARIPPGCLRRGTNVARLRALQAPARDVDPAYVVGLELRVER